MDIYTYKYIQLNRSDLSWLVHMTGLYKLKILKVSFNSLMTNAFLELSYLFDKNKKYFYHSKMKISVCSLLAISTI